jgi:hypothetical protein
MGSIDLDPASCELANRTVKARRYHSKEDNGLAQMWYGRVWCNPPYGRTTGIRSYQSLFIEKLLREYQSGNVLEAILLCTSDVDEVWFQPLWHFPICFPDHKVWFYRPGLPDEKHIMGSAFVYLGHNEQRFIEVFSQFGTIAKRVNPILPSSSPATLWENNQ